MPGNGYSIETGNIENSDAVAIGEYATVNKFYGPVNISPVYDIVAARSDRLVKRVMLVPEHAGPRLVGREREIVELRSQLMVGATVAVQGLPGVGKTALAFALVNDEQLHEHFSGGVLWAALGRQADVASELAKWGTHLAVDLSAATSISDRVDAINTRLRIRDSPFRDKPFLIVLDDAWSWGDAATFKKFTAPGAFVSMLLTTRDLQLARDFAGASVFRLHELSEDDAVRMLERAAPGAVVACPDGVRELARAVDGLPLALRLIGAALNKAPAERRRILRIRTDLRTAMARLQLSDRNGSGTLEAAIDCSIDALPDEPARQAFAALGVFADKPATFSTDAALAVWSGASQAAEGDQTGCTWLDELLDQGLLEDAGEDRFTVHQVLGDVARARLGAQGAEYHARHFDFYAAFVDRAQDDWRAIESELPQVRQAWTWASEAGDQNLRVLSLANAMQVYMEWRGLVSEQFVWDNRALAAARDVHNRTSEVAILGHIGWLHAGRGELDQALAQYDAALAVAQEAGDRNGQALMLRSIGKIHAGSGELDVAVGYRERAIPILREMGDRPAEALRLRGLGQVTQPVQNELAMALRYYQLALPILRETGNSIAEVLTLNNIGWVHDVEGQPAEALACYDNARQIASGSGNPAGEALSLNNSGGVHAGRGEFDVALVHYTRALSIQLESGNLAGAAATLHNVGWVQALRGAFDLALAEYQRALAIQRDLGNRAGEAATLRNMGWTYAGRGDSVLSQAYYNWALAIQRGMGSTAGQAATLRNMAWANTAFGSLNVALRCAEQVVDLEKETQHPDTELDRVWLAGLRKFAEQHAGSELREVAGSKV